MLTGFIRRASTAILGSSDDESDIEGQHGIGVRRHSTVGSRGFEASTDDGEIVYCKNNVCVHPPVQLHGEAEHRPGYLAIRMHHEEGCHPTLILTWIPNTSLKKNPRSIENRTPTLSTSPCRSTRSSACPSPVRRSSSRNSLPAFSYCSDGTASTRRPSLSSVDNLAFKGSMQNGHSNKNRSCPASSDHLPSPDKGLHYNVASDNSSCASHGPIGPAEVREALEAMITDLNQMSVAEEIVNPTNIDNTFEEESNQELVSRDAGKKDLRLTLHNCTSNDVIDEALTDNVQNLPAVSTLYLNTPDISITRHEGTVCPANSDLSLATSDRDPSSKPTTPTKSSTSAYPTHRIDCPNLSSYYMEGTADSFAVVQAPASAGPFSDNETLSPSQLMNRQACSFFSVDLAQMKSLRLFFSNRECTCGQLVIASRESQYKILHFHHGGLDRLAGELEKWDLFVAAHAAKADPACPYRQFSISRPKVTQEECHPEEDQYGPVDELAWSSYLNDDGQIEEEFHLRKAIFFGGLDHTIRKTVWPFLLHYYSFMSTYDERVQMRKNRFFEYHVIRKRRESMNESDKEAFWRNVECTVEKDVVRTDRSNPFFAGDDNPNLEIMRNILLNYAVYNPTMGYTQGMSDLLAPLLTEVQDESDTFWCFVGLMQRTIFISSPKDNDMDKHLNFIRELIRLMLPKFYAHLKAHHDSMELLFCHRWILLCFKREFPDGDALKMWESCWAHYQTDYFHLFLCVAIMAIYSDDVIEQGMNPDEMLLYFSSLSVHMNGELVLRKARGLLHQFRQMPRIPCTVHGLCEMCGPGMWDSGHVPVVECVGGHETNDGACPLSIEFSSNFSETH